MCELSASFTEPSLKYRLSCLPFVATFTFHRQYFQAIWRVDSLNTQNVSKYLAYIHCYARGIKREILPPSYTTCFHRLSFFSALELNESASAERMTEKSESLSEILKCALFRVRNRCPFFHLRQLMVSLMRCRHFHLKVKICFSPVCQTQLRINILFFVFGPEVAADGEKSRFVVCVYPPVLALKDRMSIFTSFTIKWLFY